MKNKILGFLFGRDVIRPEIYSILMNILWGLWLLHPSEALSNEVFKSLTKIAGEPVWGVLAFSIGVIQLIARLGNSVAFRKNMLLISSIFWGFISLFTFLSCTNSPAPLVYGLQSFLFGWTFLRLAYEETRKRNNIH